MPLLEYEEHKRLLHHLLNAPGLPFHKSAEEFRSAFPHQDRLRACCIVGALLEQSKALTTAQRLGGWFLLHDSQAAGVIPSQHPLVCLLVRTVHDSNRLPVERNLVLQLLQGHGLQELQATTPFHVALSHAAPLLAHAPDTRALEHQYLGGASCSTPLAWDGELPAGILSPGPLLGLQREGSFTPTCNPGSPMLGINGHASAHPTTSCTQRAGKGLSSHALTGDLPGGPGRDRASSDSGSSEGTAGPDSGRGGASTGPGPAAVAGTPPVAGLGGAAGHFSNPTSPDPGAGPQANSISGGGEEGHVGRVRELVVKALKGPLLPAEQQVVLSEVERGTPLTLVQRLGLAPAMLPALVEHAPSVAYELLVKLMGTHLISDYYMVLATSDLSLHSMEVVNRLATTVSLPTEFVHLYITNCIRSCEGAQDKYIQNRLVRLVCVFIQSLIRNRVIPITDLLHEVQSFCINFSRIREAAKLFRLLKQLEAGGSGGRGGAGDALGGLGSPGGSASPTAGSGGIGSAGPADDESNEGVSGDGPYSLLSA